MVGEPKYDEDVINLGYLNSRLGKLDTELGNTNELLFSKSQNFGTLPQPPYRRYDTYMGPDGIYICHTERLIGEYNSADWGKASTYENVGDAFDRGIITAGTLQAVNGGNYAAGMTGQGTGDGSVRIWAGSTYGDRGSAPFRVTQGGAVTATDITITGGSVAGGLITSGINAGNITAGTISTERLSADVITTNNFSAQSINADNITSGTITGRTITGSTIDGSSITADSSINITRSGGSYFFNMGVSTSHPNVSGINIGWGGASFGDKSISLQSGYYWNMNAGMIINCDGLRKDTAGDLIIRNNITSSRMTLGTGLQITAGNIDLTSTTSSIYIGKVLFSGNNMTTSNGSDITLGSHLTLRSANSSYGVYARGLSVTSNSTVTTAAGQASSRNVKTNIEKFDNNRYSKALNILSELEMYDYDYKYSLYKKNKQYGFIIDEIEQIEGHEEFFDFYKSEAIIEEENGLNFAVEDDLPGERIEVKQYQPDVLDKYLLTVCKALQMKINDLEERIKKLEEGGR